MRGMFVALMIMGSVWTGGLVWSLFGGAVLVPASAVGPRAAVAPAVVPAPPIAAKPAAPAPAQQEPAAKPQLTAAPAAAGHDAHGVSHAAAVPTSTRGNELLPARVEDGVKIFDVTAKIVQWEVAPGEFVEAWTYNGIVPGPLLRVTEGDKIRINLKNELPEPTIIHIHGPMLPNAMDGVPDVTQPPIKPGEKFTYEFVAKGPAVGMYHSHHHAEHQVPDGLVGAIIIDDMPVPAGVTVSQRMPMVLNDAGVIGLSLNGKSFPATLPAIAKLGEWVMIDYFNEGLQIHPMHLHGLPQQVIAKDGIPLAVPYSEDVVNVAPGERYTVLVHATEPGVWAWHCHILTHAEGDNGMFGMVTTFIVKE